MAAGWDAVLAPGETVLWEGRPDRGFHVPLPVVGQTLRALAGLAIFVYIAWRLRLPQAPEWDVLVAILAVFFMSIPLGLVGDMALRRMRRYALTTRRALIATDFPVWGLHLRSIPVERSTPVDYLAGRHLSSVRFGRTPGLAGAFLARPLPAGFERIAEGARVLALVDQVQGRAA